MGFVLYWVAVAVCAGFVGVSETVYNYVVHDEDFARRRTRHVVGQLLPSLARRRDRHGELVRAPESTNARSCRCCRASGRSRSGSASLRRVRTSSARADGRRCISARLAPCLLWTAGGPETLNAWAVGGTFGVGQLLTAGVLYWNLEQDEWR